METAYEDGLSLWRYATDDAFLSDSMESENVELGSAGPNPQVMR